MWWQKLLFLTLLWHKNALISKKSCIKSLDLTNLNEKATSDTRIRLKQLHQWKKWGYGPAGPLSGSAPAWYCEHHLNSLWVYILQRRLFVGYSNSLRRRSADPGSEADSAKRLELWYPVESRLLRQGGLKFISAPRTVNEKRSSVYAGSSQCILFLCDSEQIL